MMGVLVKICGLAETDGLDAAVEAGMDFAGFVFYPGSPRALSPEAAADLADALPDEITKVGLFVDPTDDDLDRVLRQFRLDLIQLHGNESPERVDRIRLEFGLPVMKAIGIAAASDLDRARAYEGHADWLLFDAKPMDDDTRPGGLGRSFPWHLLQDWRGETPWMLAGGLTPENVERAVAESGAGAVDVSSGVESAPGVKDPARIAAFLRAAKNARASW